MSRPTIDNPKVIGSIAGQPDETEVEAEFSLEYDAKGCVTVICNREPVLRFVKSSCNRKLCIIRQPNKTDDICFRLDCAGQVSVGRA